MDQLDLDAVATFLVLLEVKHYGRAAARLHLTQSAVTRRLHRLETYLGAVLLERDGNGVRGPTTAGAQFAVEAKALLQQAHLARQAVRQRTEPDTVRLGVPGSVGDYPERDQLRAIAGLLRTELPGVRLQCVGVPMGELGNCLRDHQVDVLWTAAVRDCDDRVSYTDLTTVSRVGLVGQEHDLAETDAIDGQAFAVLPMLCDFTAPPKWMSLWLLNDVRPRGRDADLVGLGARPDKAEIVRRVRLGHAVCVVHEPMVKRVPPSLHVVRLTGVDDVRYVAARRGNDHRDAVSALIHAMRSVAAVI